MAFFIVKGVMGSGKSMYGAEEILRCLKQGGVIHTNMPLRLDEIASLGFLDRVVMLPPNASDICYQKPGEQLPNGTMPKPTLHSDYLIGGKEGSENLVVIDEAALEFDIDTQVGDRGKNKPIFTLVAMCRHVGLDLLFLTQSDGNIDAKLRRMCERQITCIKTSRIPFFGWLLAKLPFLGDFCRIYTNRQEVKPCGMTWHRLDPVAASIYNTHGMRDGIKIVAEGTRRKSMDITERKGKVWLTVTLCIICGLLLFSYFNGSRLLGKYTAKPEPVKAGAGGKPGAPGSVASALASAVAKKKTHKDAVAEWDTVDEYPTLYALKSGSGRACQVRTRNGLTLHVGGHYQGWLIRSYVRCGDYHHFLLENGSWVVSRPVLSEEVAAAAPSSAPKALFTTPAIFGTGK